MPENEKRKAYKRAYKAQQRRSGKLKNICIEFYSADMALYEHAKAQGSMAAYVKQLIREDMEPEPERTCEYIGDHISGGCSECRGWLDPACAYCPNCGARVKEDTDAV